MIPFLRYVRVLAMNEPITIEGALIGREISLDDSDEILNVSPIQSHPPASERKPIPSCRSEVKIPASFLLNSVKSSHISFVTKRDDTLKNLEISAQLRTLDSEGIIFVLIVRIKFILINNFKNQFILQVHPRLIYMMFHIAIYNLIL